MGLSQVTAYITLSEAAERFGISEKSLLEKVKSGRIAAGESPNGELLVAEQDVDPSQNIKREDFEHLRGRTISASAAGRKYSQVHGIKISHRVFSRWAELGYIKVIDRGYRLQLDEADVAFCAAVYKAKHEVYDGQIAGVPIFDKDGNPYKVKYPDVAAKMRAERRQAGQNKRSSSR